MSSVSEPAGALAPLVVVTASALLYGVKRLGRALRGRGRAPPARLLSASSSASSTDGGCAAGGVVAAITARAEGAKVQAAGPKAAAAFEIGAAAGARATAAALEALQAKQQQQQEEEEEAQQQPQQDQQKQQQQQQQQGPEQQCSTAPEAGAAEAAVAAAVAAEAVAAAAAAEAVAEAAPPMQALYDDLCRVFAEERALQGGARIDAGQAPEAFARLNARVTGLVRAYVDAGHADFRKYAHFCRHHYVRNLIDANEDFELMLLCWSKGQGSRVHNHASSHCWLFPLAGEMVEQSYAPAQLPGDGGEIEPAEAPQLPGVLAATSPCPELQPTGAARVGPGGYAYINDRIGLHAVRIADDCDAEPGAVTLHLYAPPIKRVKLYEPENGRVVQRTPGFFTVRGHPVKDCDGVKRDE